MECIYKGTFRLSFVEKFILFQSVLYQRLQCIPTSCTGSALATGELHSYVYFLSQFEEDLLRYLW